MADLRFPPEFKFGAATAAYQIEGAWNVSDKGESIWDRFCHADPPRILDGSTGDVACDSYNQWQKDVQLVADMGLDFYRFSLSWPRLLPTGFPNQISEDGVRYYNNLIDGLLAKGIEPVVTLFHWDLPQPLQDLGGWANPLIADWFADYARVVYSLYADRVKTWLTINEPIAICDIAYNTGVLAPGLKFPDFGGYLSNKNVLLAHAKAWRIYDQEYKPKYGGKVSLANQLFWFEATSPEHEDLAELIRQNMAGRFSHPIYSKEGGWPKSIEKALAEKSKKEGLPRSKLPSFTQEEIDLIKGTYDYYGLNHYTSRMVRPAKAGEEVRVWPVYGAPDYDAVLEGNPNWTRASSIWFLVYPEGIRKLMLWLKQQYGDVPILITENGFATSEDNVDDEARVDYYRKYLEQVLLSINVDKVNVIGYTAWTLIDNFEWFDGYTNKFGLVKVDFNDPERKRTPRRSAKFYKQVVANRGLAGLDEKNIKYDEKLYRCCLIL